MSHGHNRITKNRKSWEVKESKLLPETAANERVDLDPFKFDALLEQKGVNVKVYRTLFCPKVKSVDGAEHEIDCTLCNGSGFLDVDPICTKMLITHQTLDKMSKVEGMVDGNTVTATFPIGIELQYFTLVELVDFTDIFPQRVLRKAGSDVDVLKYKACRVNVLIDYANNRYFQDQDFKIDLNGNIQWLSGGSKPADGVAYSIHYEAKVQFRATHADKVNRFSQYKTDGKIEHLKYPERWLLAKEFLVKRRDLDGNELQQGPFDSHVIVDES